MLALALILTTVGIGFINQNGSFTTDTKKRLVGLIMNMASLIIFCDLYGVARGLFIYLAAFALIGILVIFILPTKNTKRDITTTE